MKFVLSFISTYIIMLLLYSIFVIAINSFSNYLDFIVFYSVYSAILILAGAAIGEVLFKFLKRSPIMVLVSVFSLLGLFLSLLSYLFLNNGNPFSSIGALLFWVGLGIISANIFLLVRYKLEKK